MEVRIPEQHRSNKEVGDKVVTKSNIKFILSNLACMLITLNVLLNFYSLIGLIAFFSGSGLLFLGTMLDKDKSRYGVSNKFPFYVFMVAITLFGIWIPFILLNENSVTYPNTNAPGVIIGLVAFVVCSSAAASDKMNPYKKRIFKYLGMIAFFVGVDSAIFHKLKGIYIFVIIAVFFAICDMYCYKTKADDPDYYSEIKPDKAYWMGMLISAFLLFVKVFAKGYLEKFILLSNFKMDQVLEKEYTGRIFTDSALFETLDKLLSDVNVFVFVLMMVTLAVVFIFADNSSSLYEYHDAYLVLSLGGFCLILRTFISGCDVNTFVILCFALVVYLFFGFSMRNKTSINHETYKNNVIHKLIRINKYVPLLFSVGVTIFSLLSIGFVNAGYIVSWLTLIICVILLLAVRNLFTGAWTKNTMYWQFILLSILVFCITISVQNNTTSALPLLIYLFIITSLVVWVLGLRDTVRGSSDKIYLASKIFDCVILGAIGLIAVI